MEAYSGNIPAEPISDSDLMMLENLCYINDAAKAADLTIPRTPGESVGDMLSAFDEAALRKLEQGGEETQQWAAMIRYIQGNERLCNLVQQEQFKDDKGKILATAYSDPANPGQGIVSFNGTTTGECWFDNATGLGTADTDVQKRAKKFVDGLGYDNLTLVGHSKGGNLAQYCTITCDNVDRCISMDGQGFSQEFMDKYWAEIELRGHKITNYSIDKDFVHILLYPVPNSNQKYCQADRIGGIDQYHYANSFFQYDTVIDENGNKITVIRQNTNGEPNVIDDLKENEMMTYLHEFTCFALSTMPLEEREQMGIYIGNLLQLAMTGEPIVGRDGRTYKDVLDYLLSDEEMFTKLFAYIIKYVETYNLSMEDMEALFSLFGMDKVLASLEDYLKEHPIKAAAIGIGGATLIEFIYKQITDGDTDHIISTLLGWASGWLNEKLGDLLDRDVNLDWKAVWNDVEDEYNDIPAVSPDANQNYKPRTGRQVDYSEEAYAVLCNTVNQVNRMGSTDVSSWKNQVGEKWYTKIFVATFVSGINKFNRHIVDMNAEALAGINDAFDRVSAVDASGAKNLEEKISALNVLKLALE